MQYVIKNRLEYSRNISQLCTAGQNDVSHTRMTTLILILSELSSLIVKATMPSILNIVRNIFMRPYGSVEAISLTQKNFGFWIWILCQNSLTRELKIRFVGLVL